MDKIKLAKNNFIHGQLSGSAHYTSERADVLNTLGTIDSVDILIIIRTCLSFSRKEFNILSGFHASNSARISSAETRNGSFGAVMQKRIIDAFELPECIFTSNTTTEVLDKLTKWAVS